jgi:hypothetical protein
MKIIKRNTLRRGGFAGLRETRLVMSPRIFRNQCESGTSPGLGKFAYLADARFLPFGDTRMHAHREIDVISIMVEGRIQHEGSLHDGQELKVDDIQVQRAGGEGFCHNETNPDAEKNRMIQLWVIPEISDQPAAYQIFHAQAGERTRVYGGAPDQDTTIPARTVVEIAHMQAGERIKQAGRCLTYMTTGSGLCNKEKIAEGDLIDTRDFDYKASTDSKLILIYET